ncbi:NEDD4-binding protein 2 like protein [Argiope bruennichi]|uniref:NEDD4-binding protein 2 like protein n=1 Tax=Argiope bruennichi TaxID=94029 RepID=A0A8T0FDY6_ARGBR|nr:NEDD4-binding protein 2 like protein [Argiope bruennichi]
MQLKNTEDEPMLFSDILKIQETAELHKREELKQDFNTKIKDERKVYEIYLETDPFVLDEIFQSQNFEYDTTTEVLEHLELQENSADISIEVIDNWNKSNVSVFGDWTGITAETAAYDQDATDHRKKKKAADKTASELMLQHNNIGLDSTDLGLHELFVHEAISTLSKFLDSKSCIRRCKIITGGGKHSLTGPNIRPAVIQYLEKEGYKFSANNPGFAIVYLHPPGNGAPRNAIHQLVKKLKLVLKLPNQFNDNLKCSIQNKGQLNNKNGIKRKHINGGRMFERFPPSLLITRLNEIM